nr:succinylglutamate desuccinylase/aspartoacylase family protein [uncultured Flavobacterium sp.]
MEYTDNNGIKLFSNIIYPGEEKMLEFTVGQLHTMTPIKIPIYVNRSKNPGPTIMFSAGMHGDEINGIDIVREIISKNINKPKCGTIICIPIFNLLSFYNQARDLPDGRDLNRAFPGSNAGSLASMLANKITKEIIPNIDLIIDFHTGGDKRFNAAQIRVDPKRIELFELAQIFNAPFTVYSKNIDGTFRETCDKNGVKILLFEGGMSWDINDEITNIGIEGVKRILKHYNMLQEKHQTPNPTYTNKVIEKTSWLRTKYSGLFKTYVNVGDYVTKGQKLATCYDPYGQKEFDIVAQNNCYLINVNKNATVYSGDAVFNVSKIK